MFSQSSRRIAFAAASVFTSTMADFTHDQFHAPHEKRLATPFEGCYSSAGSLISQGSKTWQSYSACQAECGESNSVMAFLGGDECYCGNTLPSSSDKVAQSECSSPCTGYGQQPCGGSAVYGVFLTGHGTPIVASGGGSESSAAPSSSSVVIVSSAAPSFAYTPVSITPASSTIIKTSHAVTTDIVSAHPTTIVNGKETIVKTVAPAVETVQSSSDSSSSSSKTSPVGIAVGVVVGLLLVAAIIVFMVFYLRRRRRLKNAENGHARADSLNAFAAQGGTLPGLAPVVVADDTRLDPRIMVERRRMSAVSLADNQDYSRRILKVANPSDD